MIMPVIFFLFLCLSLSVVDASRLAQLNGILCNDEVECKRVAQSLLDNKTKRISVGLVSDDPVSLPQYSNIMRDAGIATYSKYSFSFFKTFTVTFADRDQSPTFLGYFVSALLGGSSGCATGAVVCSYVGAAAGGATSGLAAAPVGFWTGKKVGCLIGGSLGSLTGTLFHHYYVVDSFHVDVEDPAKTLAFILQSIDIYIKMQQKSKF